MAGYVGNVPVPQSVREDQSFTATAGQTTFNTLGYTDGNRIKVTLNGVLLEGGGVDYTATNGSDVVLTVAAVVDDIVRFETFNEVQLVSNTSTTPIIKTNLTLKNDTHEDTDGGRESTVIFSGEQSGGEITTLAEIEASHDGTADDQKGDLIFRTNDGNDGTSPTERLRINSGGDMLFSSEDPSLTLANTTHEDSDGGRESTIAFQGEQSGGEISLLAQIEAAHDGTADDQKGDLIFRTNDGSDGTSPTEAMRIDSAQNVGIKTTLPVAPLHVDSDNGFGNILLSRDGGAGGRRPFGIGITGAADNDLTISASVDTDQAGAFEGDRKEIVRFLAGGGMTFNGDTAAANALDDYETGTFQLTMTGAANTSALGHGQYVKIGNICHFSWYSGSQSITSSVSGVLGGLPFTHISPNNSAYAAVTFAHNNCVSDAASGYINIGTTSIYPTANNNSAASNTSTGTKYVMCSGSYTVG